MFELGPVKALITKPFSDKKKVPKMHIRASKTSLECVIVPAPVKIRKLYIYFQNSTTHKLGLRNLSGTWYITFASKTSKTDGSA